MIHSITASTGLYDKELQSDHIAQRHRTVAAVIPVASWIPVAAHWTELWQDDQSLDEPIYLKESNSC